VNPLITGDRIGVSRGDATILAAVDVAVRPGEVVAAVGPNGAGKTTLLRVLAGDLSPTSGTVRLAGSPLDEVSRRDRSRMRAVLPQHRPADIPFRVREVVMMGRHPHRRDPDNSAAADAAAVAAALAATDTTDLASRDYPSLSGGEQARVALARVLAQETPLVLLDEPTAGLDVGHEELVLGGLRRLSREGRGVFTVLHDLNAAARHADRIVLLERGAVAATGTPGEVLDAAVLSRVYAQPMRVIPHPFRHCPLVLTVER
jgi:iron complex transport system ATP-binding protein